jgi:hypothetical protein
MYCNFHFSISKKSNLDLWINCVFSEIDRAISNVEEGEKYSILLLLIVEKILGKLIITILE